MTHSSQSLNMVENGARAYARTSTAGMPNVHCVHDLLPTIIYLTLHNAHVMYCKQSWNAGETRARMLESVLLIFFLQFLLCFCSSSARYVCVRPVRVRMTYFPLYATYIGCIHDVSSNTATCAYTVLPPHIRPMSQVYMT